MNRDNNFGIFSNNFRISIFKMTVLISSMLLSGCTFKLNSIDFGVQVSTPVIAYTSSPFTCTVGTPINLSPSTFTSVASTSISPSLPAGLTLTSSTGVISGTPTVTSTLTTYTITATSTDGQISIATIQIKLQETYEYIYLGDQNNANLTGYSINLSSGVLTAIPNAPAAYAGSLTVANISSSIKALYAEGGSFFSGFLIAPTTGVLSPVTSQSTFNGGQSQVLASSLGSYLFSIDGSQQYGWMSSINPITGDLTNPIETPILPNPLGNNQNTWNIVLSPDGDYVYFVDPYDNAIAGYRTGGGALNIMSGSNIGDGTHVGDQTYGLTLLASPNSGQYDNAAPPYLDAAAGIIYFLYRGATGSDNNWLYPFKIGSDGSLISGTPLNLGLNPGSGIGGNIIGDSAGRYIFVSEFSNVGVNTYSIGLNGALTEISGPVFAGYTLDNLMLNTENTLLIGEGNGGEIYTASLDPSSGVLTSVSSQLSPCNNWGPLILDPNAQYIYHVNYGSSPNTLCGMTIDASGNLGNISGQSYPLPITGSNYITQGVAVKMTSP